MGQTVGGGGLAWQISRGSEQVKQLNVHKRVFAFLALQMLRNVFNFKSTEKVSYTFLSHDSVLSLRLPAEGAVCRLLIGALIYQQRGFGARLKQAFLCKLERRWRVHAVLVRLFNGCGDTGFTGICFGAGGAE